MRRVGGPVRIASVTLLLAAILGGGSHAIASLPGGPCTGSNWAVVPSANIGKGANTLYGVATLSATDAWAVGSVSLPNGAHSQTLIERWNGVGWSTVSSPSPGSDHNQLNAVAAVSSDDVWAVGWFNNLSSGERPLALHWDGVAWTQVPTVNIGLGSNYFTSLAIVSSSDIWALGGYFSVPAQAYGALAEHWDGLAWTPVIVPSTGGDSYFTGGVAFSSTRVWGVGTQVSGHGNLRKALSQHWDGLAWEKVNMPNPADDANYPLDASATAPADMWAVGFFYESVAATYETLAEHWDGTAWSIVSTPNISRGTNRLNGVLALESNTAWAVGFASEGSSFREDTLIQHWDGSTWTVVASPNGSGVSNELNGISIEPDGALWAVGSTGDLSVGKARTLIERCSS